jgi:hypothetical protein
MLESSPASNIWGIMIVGGLLPTGVEVLGMIHVRSRAKSASNYKN